jgi:hypothetical protein
MLNKSGNLLERYTGRGDAVTTGDAIVEIEDLGAFGYLRGMHEKSVMVELRRRSGETMAIAYSYVDRIHYEPSDGITLHCGSRVVRIRGRSLNREIRPNVTLFQSLTRARVPWIAEADEASALKPGNGVVIELIEWD